MDNLFGEPLFYIYFIYGLSFMVMAYLIVNGISRATDITLVSTFYLLAFFGLTHGTTELVDWIRYMVKMSGSAPMPFLAYVSQTLLVISYVFLLQFAVNLATYKTERRGMIRSIPLLLLAVYIAALFVLRVSDVLRAGLIGRYAFGFLGAGLSALMLFRLGRTMKPLGNGKLVGGLTVSSVGFGCYAVFGGLIVQPIAGLPVQLFRAVCALTIAISSASILDVFKA